MNMFLMSLLAAVGPVWSDAQSYVRSKVSIGAGLLEVEEIAVFIEQKLANFDPRMKNESVVGAEERHHLSLALAGIIRRLVAAETRKP